MPGLSNVDIEFNQGYGYQNMEGIIRFIDYGAINGGFVPLSTQQRGACMFHAFRKCISCPREFTNSHLRRMIVSFICSRAEELYPMLVCSISGNYGHIRLSAEEYKRKQDSNQLTEQERQEFHEPGPFSIVTHCEALLKPNFLLWRGAVPQTPFSDVQNPDYCFGWGFPYWNQSKPPECSPQCRCNPCPRQQVSLHRIR